MLFLLLVQIQCILEWKAIAWELFPFVSWEYSVNSIGTTTQYYKMRNSIVIYFSTRRKHFLAAQICMQCILCLSKFPRSYWYVISPSFHYLQLSHLFLLNCWMSKVVFWGVSWTQEKDWIVKWKCFHSKNKLDCHYFLISFVLPRG